jgi:metallophosphoesterase (TIGR00282 family)
MATISILVVGDIAGKPGMLVSKHLLPRLIAEKEVDFVIANGENTARGIGITPDLAKELLDRGVNCITTGNHVWRHQEIRPYIESEPRLIRPANYHKGQPGSGFGIYETAAGVAVGVVNLAGRVYMEPSNNPFTEAETCLKALAKTKVVIVDFHAEATSEKRAMGFFLAGRVTAVVGTHTHIQTSDEQILESGTAYITDIGMTGPHDSVIGMRKDLMLERFATGMPGSFKVAKHGVRLQAVLIRADAATGRAVSIERINLPADL